MHDGTAPSIEEGLLADIERQLRRGHDVIAVAAVMFRGEENRRSPHRTATTCR
jgi:hypothetical protein